MREFVDNKGRTWSIMVNVFTVKRVRDLVKVDLPGLFGDSAKLSELLTDTVKLVDVIWVLIRKQAEDRSVDEEDFCSALGGDKLESAMLALLEDTADFFPSQKATLAKRLLGKMREVNQKVIDKGSAKLVALDCETLAEKLMTSSGDVPASAA